MSRFHCTISCVYPYHSLSIHLTHTYTPLLSPSLILSLLYLFLFISLSAEWHHPHCEDWWAVCIALFLMCLPLSLSIYPSHEHSYPSPSFFSLPLSHHGQPFFLHYLMCLPPSLSLSISLSLTHTHFPFLSLSPSFSTLPLYPPKTMTTSISPCKEWSAICLALSLAPMPLSCISSLRPLHCNKHEMPASLLKKKSTSQQMRLTSSF